MSDIVEQARHWRSQQARKHPQIISPVEDLVEKLEAEITRLRALIETAGRPWLPWM